MFKSQVHLCVYDIGENQHKSGQSKGDPNECFLIYSILKPDVDKEDRVTLSSRTSVAPKVSFCICPSSICLIQTNSVHSFLAIPEVGLVFNLSEAKVTVCCLCARGNETAEQQTLCNQRNPNIATP